MDRNEAVIEGHYESCGHVVAQFTTDSHTKHSKCIQNGVERERYGIMH